MRATTLLALWLLVGCQSTTPSGAIFQPVKSAPAAPVPAGTAAPAPAGTAAPAPEGGGFDFDADARKQDEGTDSTGAPLEPGQVASALGLGETPAGPTPVESPPEAAPTPTPAPPTAAPTPAVPPAPPAWTPASPLEGSWGVRLVSTVPEAQPPRAILGMADGSEVVVQPGTLLPDAHLAVLAVGRDAVQLAEFIPSGDHVRVETRVLQPMYNTAQPPR